MYTATTTCGYYNPVGTDGITPPASPIDTFAFASSTCITVSDQATSSPAEVYRDDNIVFGLGVIILLLGCMVFFNMFFGKHAQHD